MIDPAFDAVVLAVWAFYPYRTFMMPSFLIALSFTARHTSSSCQDLDLAGLFGGFAEYLRADRPINGEIVGEEPGRMP
jgi:hypothetical protein